MSNESLFPYFGGDNSFLVANGLTEVGAFPPSRICRAPLDSVAHRAVLDHLTSSGFPPLALCASDSLAAERSNTWFLLYERSSSIPPEFPCQKVFKR